MLVLKTEPEYSEEARKAKVQGTVVLSIVVTASGGQVSSVRVIRSLGLGLDERAIEAVRQWKIPRRMTVNGKLAGHPGGGRSQFQAAVDGEWPGTITAARFSARMNPVLRTGEEANEAAAS